VCFGPGIVAGASALWRDVPPPAYQRGRALLREWCGEVWSAGAGVRYQPTVVAVRLAGDGGEPRVPLEQSSWRRVADLRPARPRDLNDGAWRHLLAHDDVDACRG
jgi:hypothetical protein